MRYLALAALLLAPLPAVAAATITERPGGLILEAEAVPLGAALDLLAVRFGFVLDWPDRPADQPLLDGVYAGSVTAVLDQLLQGVPHGIVGTGGRVATVSVARRNRPPAASSAFPPPALPAAAAPDNLPGLAASFQAIAARPRPAPLKDQFGIGP